MHRSEASKATVTAMTPDSCRGDKLNVYLGEPEIMIAMETPEVVVAIKTRYDMLLVIRSKESI